MVTPAVLKEISKDGGRELKADIEKLLVKIKSTGLDPMGWGLRYGSRHFNNDTEMEEWQHLYSKLQFEATVNVDIKYSGMIK